MDFLGHVRYSETNLFFPHWKLKKTLKFFKPDWLVVTPTHMGIFFMSLFDVSGHFESVLKFKKFHIKKWDKALSPGHHFSAYLCL